MPLSLHIEGDNATELLASLRTVASALLGSTAIVSGNTPIPSPSTYIPSPSAPSVPGEAVAEVQTAQASGENAGKTDAAGTVFDPARHTGSIVKSGLWRLKAGLSRGPGEDLPEAAAGSPPPPPPANAAAAPADEEDEFAAFATAAAPVTASARNWSDADLSALCNQGAVKDGKADRVKAIIAKFIPEGQVQHSRNIPADQREAFATEVETTLGIQFGA